MNHWLSIAIAVGLALLGTAAFVSRGKDNAVAVPTLIKLYVDEQPGAYTLVGRHASPLEKTTLVLDMENVERVSPSDMMRALLNAARAMHQEHRAFEQVRLARAGSTVYEMDGPDFAELGKAHAEGENPVYLIRTLPEKLRAPGGAAAFETWTGGLLGVTTQQMEDVVSAGKTWAGF